MLLFHRFFPNARRFNKETTHCIQVVGFSTKQKCWSDAIATAKEYMKLVDMLEFRQRYLRQYVTCG